MSTARANFSTRIGLVDNAISNFNLRDQPPNPANVQHNNSVKIIRNGLAVQSFNIFEDFIKARTVEILNLVNNSGVSFAELPESFQKAATIDALKAVEHQLRLREKGDQIRYVQDLSEKIFSTKTSALQLPETAFFHSTSNITKDQFRDALTAFAVEQPWSQCFGLCSRIGISGMPADGVFQSFAQRRHKSAHSPSFSVSEIDLSQSVTDAISLALSYDVLITSAIGILCKTPRSSTPKSSLITSHTTIPLRFIKFKNNAFCEIKEGGQRSICRDADPANLLSAAKHRAKSEGGALVVFNSSGKPVDWFI